MKVQSCLAVVIALCVNASNPHHAMGQTGYEWLPMGGVPGVNGTGIEACVSWDPDDVGPDPALLVCGGDFTLAGDTQVSNMAAWNGSSWQALGSGVNSTVRALTVFNGDLIAGGFFTTADGSPADRVARWDGASWQTLGTGMSDAVYDLAVFDGDLIACGQFMTAGGSPANRIARWDGANWQAMGGGMNNSVWALAVYNSELYAGGPFQTSDGSPGDFIARWNGSSWQAVGTGMQNSVVDMTVYNSELVAGGYFTSAGGTPANYVARWNGSTWQAFGIGMNANVNAISAYGGELFAGGIFTLADGLPANYIARWNGSSWQAMGSGTTSDVNVLAVHDGALYAGGDFGGAGGLGASNIARWNGSWSALGSGGGLNGNVVASVIHNDELVVAGAFLTAGATPAHRIARWNGTNWQAFGAGLGDRYGTGSAVLGVTVYNGDLIAGGGFFTPTSRIARWDGANWQSLGSGMNSVVRAVTVYDGDLIAAGDFTTAGGVPANYIARWDGVNWHPLGTGLNSSIASSLAVYNNELYVAGNFTAAGGVPASHIARWDGANWQALGSGTPDTPQSMLVFEGELIVGGGFSDAGGVPNTFGLARWNGTDWLSFSEGNFSSVHAMAAYNGHLYIGGTFTFAEAVAANRVARWDGTAWHAMDGGVAGGNFPRVNALAAYNGEIVAGGTFFLADGEVSAHWARWRPTILYVDDDAAGASTGFTWTDAYPYLQDALSYAAGHPEITEIWVAAGTYQPDKGTGITIGDRAATFQMLNGVSLYGGFAGGETALSEREVAGNPTVLSGDLSGDDGPAQYEDYTENSYHVVTGDGTNSSAVLDGFTITGGNANGIPATQKRGGGLTILAGSLTVRNCTFTANVATEFGGAVSNVSGGPSFRSCTFTYNEATTGDGGALYNFSSGNVALVQAFFLSNGAGADGGAIHSAGGSTTTVVRAYFGFNSASNGGAVASLGAGTVNNLYNCDFWANAALSGVGGGAVYQSGPSAANLSHCTLGENTALGVGGLGGGVYASGGPVDVKNSILWGNSDSAGLNPAAQFRAVSASHCLNYSIIQGGWSGCGGTGVLNSDPLYLDPANHNHFLLQNSPAVDAGDNTAVPLDTLDMDLDGDTAERLPLDAYGRDRFTDNPLESDMGMSAPGYPEIVDMGAYETPLILYWYVDADATGTENGTSWAQAFTKLQDGLAATGTAPNEVIWVAEGTYYPDEGVGIPPDDRTDTFQLKSGVELYGGFAGFEYDLSQRDIEANPTILSGDLAGNDGPNFANYAENSYHVVTGSGTDATAIIDGFTVMHGNADVNDIANGAGAGIYIIGGSPTIVDCRFVAHSAIVFAGGGGAGHIDQTSNPHLIRCSFLGNRGMHGGALKIANSSNPVLESCKFLGNTASVVGGAISSTLNSHRATNCLFSGNTQLGAASGGAYYLSSSSPDVFQCTFVNNLSAGNGGAVSTAAGSPKFYNCIFWDNAASGGSNQSESGQIFVNTGSVTVTYSVVMGLSGLAGNGNIGGDPLFVDPNGADNVFGTSDDDLRLSSGSPAIDAGNTPALPADLSDLDGDANTTERIPFDLAGTARVYDDPFTDDTGVPGSPVVDIGAYEFIGEDCNKNGFPDECDLACGVADGPCDVPGCGGSADLNGDNFPDECAEFTGGCTANTDWSCFDNWNLPGDVYPDNDEAVTYSVTLGTVDDVFLDVSVAIDSLRIIDDAVLRVTQAGFDGDLTLVEPEGLLIDGGALFINNSRMIDASAGQTTIRNEGLYALEPPTMAPATSGPQPESRGKHWTGPFEEFESPSLGRQSYDAASPNPHRPSTAGSALRAPGEGDYDSATLTLASGGSMVLSQMMTLNVTGNFLLDGTGACECDAPSCTGGLRGGIVPPPKFTAVDSTQTTVGGDFDVVGSVNYYYASSFNLNLGGHFDHRGTVPQCFDWTLGGLTLNGSAEQTIEAPGRDVGNGLDGFYYQGLDTNFSIGTLEVATGRNVKVTNDFANLMGSGPCQEALYVRHLILRANSTLTLDNARLFYQQITQESGAMIAPEGCAAAQEADACSNDDQCADGNPCSLDVCDVGMGWCTHSAIPNLSYGDMDATGSVDVGDILCALDGFSGSFASCALERVDLAPCGGDGGTVDVGDILAVLDAFSGFPLCDDPCPP